MSHITLIRHGQANTGARDEESYDRLSDLGHQQAAWLGDHLRAAGSSHTRVYCGTLRRHVETAASMGYEDVVQDARLNEMEYFTLAQAMEAQYGLPVPQEREGFVTHLPQVFEAWAGGRIAEPYESWQDFEGRTRQALAEIAEGDGPALVVTSGGLISMAMRLALGLDTGAMARVALAIMNTSMHRLFPIGGDLSPVLFNAVPHLETPERHFAQTHL
jgi:broad specificity phosphatase PhoE